MRTGIPLREITIENIWQEVQELRTKVETHNHLTFGSQGLTGTVNGILQSPNFVSGSSGWQLKPDGDIEANSGTFRGNVTGATITGGTFQTAASGQRITINASDNYLRIYDANTQIGALGGSTDGTNRYLDLAMPDTIDQQMCRFLAQHPTGTNFILYPISKGYQFSRFQNENTNVYRNTNNIPILQLWNLGTGIGLSYMSSSDYDNLPVSLTQAFATSTNPIIRMTQEAIISTNFRKIFNETNTGCTIWISDGTTPNGNLSGQAGDICLNGNAGNIYRCTGTTNWTAM